MITYPHHDITTWNLFLLAVVFGINQYVVEQVVRVFFGTIRLHLHVRQQREMCRSDGFLLLGVFVQHLHHEVVYPVVLIQPEQDVFFLEGWVYTSAFD